MRQSLSGHMRILLRFTLEHPIVRFAFFDYFIIKNIIFRGFGVLGRSEEHTTELQSPGI
jgi:hypothetical protein